MGYKQDMEYEILGHISETGIRAFGSDLNQAFANAAKAMFSIITDPKTIGASQEVKVKVESSSLKELLVDWLNELLFIFETNGMVFGDFKVQIHDSWLEATAIGEPYLPEKHPLKTQIKATTYYGLKIDTNGKTQIEVYFDV